MPEPITKSTVLSLSIVGSMLLLVAAGATWAAEITFKQDQLALDLQRIRMQLEQGTNDRWRGADMRSWVERANREVEVWSTQTERMLGLENGTHPRFEFPDPDKTRGQ